MSDQPKPPVNKTPPASPLPEADKKTAPKFSPEAVTRNESKASQFFRSFLRWTGIALLVFGLGALAAIFLFYVPKANQLKLAEQDTATAEAKITELQTEITNLETQLDSLSSLKEDNQTLQTSLDQSRTHIALLQALADIRNAQYALALDDTAQAKIALAATTDTLTDMQSLLETDQAEVVAALLSRLELAQGELESNPFAAQSDLEVLAVSLLELEQSLFSTP
ncbi:MAG TPA: hypothetical protein PK530_15945 [Anaerolineales bacterium]|nr:hypothetical protein [Anaerolineales bacterium]